MNILFVCTHNRCRSIIAEAVTRQLTGKNIAAASAGSQPCGEVHPLSLRYLAEKGFSVDGLSSKSWNQLDGFTPDIVITVCDSAAQEACPLWLGKAIKVHWGLSDPSKLSGNENTSRAAFFTLIETLQQRVQRLTDCDFNAMSNTEIKSYLENIAEEL
ncbi:MAG: arsenate reductase ArsC [Spongiibacteraceae bacterium]